MRSPEEGYAKEVKFRLVYHYEGDDCTNEHSEIYEKKVDPDKWGREIIDWFNSTIPLDKDRKPTQKRRVFIRTDAVT